MSDKPDEALVERDIYEVSNQLLGYVDMTTPEKLAAFLIREGNEAAKLATRIEALLAENARLREGLTVIRDGAFNVPDEFRAEAARVLMQALREAGYENR